MIFVLISFFMIKKIKKKDHFNIKGKHGNTTLQNTANTSRLS